MVCCSSRDQGLGLFLSSLTYSDSQKLKLLQSLFRGKGKHSLLFISVANITALTEGIFFNTMMLLILFPLTGRGLYRQA